jgi:uncharacterized protein YuzE
MKLRYDAKLNIAYLSLKDETMQVETVQIGEELNIDVAPDGTIYGIEFMNPNEQLGDFFGIEANKEISVAFKALPDEGYDLIDFESEEEFEAEELVSSSSTLNK